MARKSTAPRSSRSPSSRSRRRVRKLPRNTDLTWIRHLHRRWQEQGEPALAA